ncbi:MAG: caspase family protein [Hyphomicrobiaceae bacterium]|nr:caspase family protein [Hyphomicrobiaceae bacterium]
MVRGILSGTRREGQAPARTARVFVLAVCAGLLFCPPAQAEPVRMALVIGTDSYERARDLSGARADAEAIADALAAEGYALYGGGAITDPDRAQMLAAMRGFARALPDGALAVVYIAGHGLASGGASYLLPADDAAIARREDLPAHAVALRFLTERLAARQDVHSLILVDACRANALAGHSPAAASDIVAPEGGAMSILYAAAPGQIAADGAGGTGPFASAVIAALDDGQASLTRFIHAVSQDVLARSGGTQQPYLTQILAAPEHPAFPAGPDVNDPPS